MAQLPRSNKQCPNCHENEAVFFQSQQRSAETGMVRHFIPCEHREMMLTSGIRNSSTCVAVVARFSSKVHILWLVKSMD